MESSPIIRRLGTPPLHHKCRDALSSDVSIFELTDGSNSGDFVFIGTPMEDDGIAALHAEARAMEDMGGVASYESVVVFKDLGRAACRIFPITGAELASMTPITPQSRAPHAEPWQL